jgi:tetratricopeptide (TPR) repeat protein
VEAYRAGRMDLAKLFFERAYRQSALEGRPDWTARAACNLADLALESRALGEAERWLEAVADARGEAGALVLWKRSQLLHARKRPREAIAALDSSLQMSRPGGLLEDRMELDRLRYLFTLEDSAAWDERFEAFRQRLRSSRRGEALGLWAWASMRRGRFAQAESLWSEAAGHYREERRLLGVGEALSHRALCLHALDRRSEALRLADQAEGVFEEMGFTVGQLRAAALRLLLEEDAVLAKSAREIDFLPGARRGDDWSELLDDYAQSYPPLLGRLELLRGR